MKPAVAKKVASIKSRVRDMKSCNNVEVKATELKPEQLKDPEQRLLKRMTGLVIREGHWLTNLAEKMVIRHEIKLQPADDLAIKESQKFFKEHMETFADEISRNLFIKRIDAMLIVHMEKMVLLVGLIDAQVKAQIAAVARLEDDDIDMSQEEIDAEMVS